MTAMNTVLCEGLFNNNVPANMNDKTWGILFLLWVAEYNWVSKKPVLGQGPV